jgi:aspartate aminotransferase-like enzyme
MHVPDNTNLRVPGPTPIPPTVREALSQQMINHRGPEFTAMHMEIVAGLQEILATHYDVLILTCSGTGGLEAAIVNTMSPGDPVLAVSVGYFGDRFTDIARAYGANVIPLNFEWGTAADPAQVEAALREHPEVKAVLVTHNETSTGVTNDLPAIARVVKSAGRLLLVDAISSAGCIPLRTDDWGLDVVITGSQKGLMIPPGLAFVAVGPDGWRAWQQARMPRFYFDFGQARKHGDKGQTPWTPAVSLYYALIPALRALRNEGLPNLWARHQRVADRCRHGVKQLGFDLLADERVASNTVTAVKANGSLDVSAMLKRLRTEHHVVLAGAQGPLSGKVFRIGHLGWVTESDIDAVLAALRAVLES